LEVLEKWLPLLGPVVSECGGLIRSSGMLRHIFAPALRPPRGNMRDFLFFRAPLARTFQRCTTRIFLFRFVSSGLLREIAPRRRWSAIFFLQHWIFFRSLRRVISTFCVAENPVCPFFSLFPSSFLRLPISLSVNLWSV